MKRILLAGLLLSATAHANPVSVAQSATVTAAQAKVAAVQNKNSISVDERIGSSHNTITIEQAGPANRIQGPNGANYAVVSGTSNTVDVEQGDYAGQNLIEMSVTGSGNNVKVEQARNAASGNRDGDESGGHYLDLNVHGNGNTLLLRQANAAGANSGHFMSAHVTGDNNTGTLRQGNNGAKKMFSEVNGNNNVFDIFQTNNGQFFLDFTLNGDGHHLTATQTGNAAHSASITLNNAGGSSNVTLLQQGNTAQDYTITQSCANLQGCSVSVTQGQ